MLKIGIVGCGHAARQHLAALRQIPDIRVVGAADNAAGPARDFAERYQVPVRSLQQLMEEVDTIDIATPTTAHLKILETVGFSVDRVIYETPLARNLAGAEELVSFCQEHDIELAPLHLTGLSGPLKNIKTKLETGELDRRGMIRIDRSRPSVPASYRGWRSDFSLSGGVILELLLGDITFLRQQLGPVERVFARSTACARPESGNNDAAGQGEYVLISIRFENGAIAHLKGSYLLVDEGEDSFEFADRNGLITYSEKNTSPLQITVKGESGVENRYRSPLADSPYLSALEKIYSAFNGQGELPYSARDSLDALAVALGAIKSATSGEPVRFSHRRD